MAKQGVKHLVKCVCVLPQLRRRQDAPTHEFPVFSICGDTLDDFETSFVQCDNCGVVHKVTDVCTSSILHGRDEMKSIVTIQDVKNTVPSKMAEVLDQHKVDLPTWQLAAWVVEAKQWGTPIVISSEYIDGTRQGKVMTIISETLYKISNFTSETVAQ
jgi:hypothetical protein